MTHKYLNNKLAAVGGLCVLVAQLALEHFKYLTTSMCTGWIED